MSKWFTSINLLWAVFIINACTAQRLVKDSEQFIFNEAPFAQCHASTIVELPGGNVHAAWFGGAYEGNDSVVICTATCIDGKWTPPVAIADGRVGDSIRYACWNPVLFYTNDKVLHLYYNLGPNPRAWWGMEKTSFDNGLTWSAAKKLPDNILGPIKNKPIQLKSGALISASSVELNENIWRAHIERSTDNGKNWIKIPIDHRDSFNAIQPAILQYKGGRLQLLCRSKEGVITQSWSEDEGLNWSPMTRTNIINPNSGIDAVSLQDGTQLLVYNPDVPGKDWFNGRGKLYLAQSSDGINWKDIAVLENGDKEEYSYPAIIQTTNGDVHITYTYNRKKIKHIKFKYM
jgi:predicted neuraminidase